MNRRKLIWASLGLCSLAATARFAAGAAAVGGPTQDLQPYRLSGHALGTTVSLLVLHEDAGRAQAALAEALAAIQAVDALMSLYRDDSQIAVLNRTGAIDGPDARVLEVLRYAQDLSARTEGAFDVTVQPLWLAFSQAKARGELPEPDELQAARARIGWQRLSVTDDRVRLDPGMAVTLNGLAQGYAADQALAALRRHGIAHALIDAGEFDALGRRQDGRSWTLGVRHPRDADALAARLVVDGRALATSGDYETVFSADFRHHHIFDPAIGDSPTELASATVLARSALEADGLSTAFMVLGAERSLALAASLAGVDTLLIGKDGRRWQSAGLPVIAA